MSPDDTARAAREYVNAFVVTAEYRQGFEDGARWAARRALLSTPVADPPTQTGSELEGQGDAPTGIVTDEMVERGHDLIRVTIEPSEVGLTVWDAEGRFIKLRPEQVEASQPTEPTNAEARRAYQRGEWCGECRHGVVEDPPCCAQPPTEPTDDRSCEQCRWDKGFGAREPIGGHTHAEAQPPTEWEPFPGGKCYLCGKPPAGVGTHECIPEAQPRRTPTRLFDLHAKAQLLTEPPVAPKAPGYYGNHSFVWQSGWESGWIDGYLAATHRTREGHDND